MSVEFGGPKGRDGHGAVFGPVHAWSFQPDDDELFAGGFHHPRTNRPTALAIRRIIRPVNLGDHVALHRLEGGPT